MTEYNEQVEGKIAAILDKTTVVINRGSDHGVGKGTEFYIYSKLGPFFDPDSGENLGETTKILGKVQATIIEKRFCVAETKYQSSYTMFSMLALESMFRTKKVELPVAESDITSFTEKIKVGFPVMIVPRIKQIENKDVLELTSSEIQESELKETDLQKDQKQSNEQETS